MEKRELELEHLKKDFEAWRGSKEKGQRIPEELWQRAVSLAKSLSINRIHQELRLDFNKLKRLVGGSKKPVKSRSKGKATFVALPPLQSAQRVDDCVLKIESVSGARMQAELSGLEAVSLGRILREFASR